MTIKSFIFTVAEGLQVVIESNNLTQAQQEYEKVKEEASKVKTRIIKVSKKKPIRKGIYEYILELKEEGFFSKSRTISEIKDKLAELAIHKPLTSFPPYLNSLIRDRILKIHAYQKNKPPIKFRYDP